MYGISQFNNECFGKKPQTSLFVFNKLLANVIVFLLVLRLRKTLNSQFTFSYPFRAFTELQTTIFKDTCFPSWKL